MKKLKIVKTVKSSTNPKKQKMGQLIKGHSTYAIIEGVVVNAQSAAAIQVKNGKVALTSDEGIKSWLSVAELLSEAGVAAPVADSAAKAEAKVDAKAEKAAAKAAAKAAKDAEKEAAKAEKLAAKEAKAAEKAKPKAPGVIATVLNTITEASAPVSQEQIADALAVAFPDKARASMENTVRAQIGGKTQPVRMEKEKNVSFEITADAEGVKYYSIAK